MSSAYNTNTIGKWQLAISDFLSGLKNWRIWCLLAHQDIRLRYRRSTLGPFWLTISMAITIYTMGFLYGYLFKMDLQHYYPFLAGGMLSWALISGIVLDATESFAASESLMKKIKLPYTLYIHRVVWRNIIIFFHNIIVIIPILIIFHQVAKVNFNTLMLIPDLLLIYLNGLLYGIVLAMIGSRYRDISQIIKSFIQVIFFVTPVMWDPNILPAKMHFIVMLNPFYAFIELIRLPLLGSAPNSEVFLMAAAVTLVGVLAVCYLFPRRRSRIIYWV
jgi:lipopolysaccharide transport system permease protein